MRYSTFNYQTQQYDYWDASGKRTTHAGSPPRALFKSSLGATPDQAAWRLPIGAVKVGSGPLPQGRIACSSAASPLGDMDTATGGKIAIALGIAYVAWKVGSK